MFRCNIKCDTDPENCISEHMYKSQADAMSAGGFAAAGCERAPDKSVESTVPIAVVPVPGAGASG